MCSVPFSYFIIIIISIVFVLFHFGFCLLFLASELETFFFLPLCHSDLAYILAIRSVSNHVLVLFSQEVMSWGRFNTHIAKYTPKGMLHGNHKVSLSRGFVRCNIIQRGVEGQGQGQGCQLRGQLFSLLFSTLHSQIL